VHNFLVDVLTKCEVPGWRGTDKAQMDEFMKTVGDLLWDIDGHHGKFSHNAAVMKAAMAMLTDASRSAMVHACKCTCTFRSDFAPSLLIYATHVRSAMMKMWRDPDITTQKCFVLSPH